MVGRGLIFAFALIVFVNSETIFERSKAAYGKSSLVTVSVTLDPKTGEYDFVEGPKLDGYVAQAQFTDMRKPIHPLPAYGWTLLSVDTNQTYPDAVQAYSAGLAEGYITQDITGQHWRNTVTGYCTPDASSPYCQRLAKYLNTNFNEYIQRSIKSLAKIDPYWHQVELFLIQVNGLSDGNKKKPMQPKTTVEPFGMLLFQINGDLEDLEVALDKPEKLRRHVLGSGSCSALVKLLPGNAELFTAQDTWSTYQSMLRIIKRYSFGYHMLDTPGSPLIPGNNMLFSSYPGNLYSGDDFYIIESNLTVMETTIGNSNKDLLAFIQPEGTVLEGIRNQVANRLATNGATWADIFSRYNSGTYNNEWMVVDYNRFKPGMKTLPSGVLTVLEQIPGMIKWDDVTPILVKQQYWASYNSPYFPEIFNASGNWAMVEKYGDWFTYDKTPRAKIFRRDHHKVTDEMTMQQLMRYNKYQKDPLSRCECTPPYSAENAISARSDLNPKNGSYPFGALGHRSHGGTDMKMTSYRQVRMLGGPMMTAVCGPTHDDQPPFSWLTADFADDTPHEGHPDVWNFTGITTNW